MKALARAILAWLLPRLPDHRREYGHAMLGELEELEGWAALRWALGGVSFWLGLGLAARLRWWAVLLLNLVATALILNAQPWVALGCILLGAAIRVHDPWTATMLGVANLWFSTWVQVLAMLERLTYGQPGDTITYSSNQPTIYTQTDPCPANPAFDCVKEFWRGPYPDPFSSERLWMLFGMTALLVSCVVALAFARRYLRRPSATAI